MTVEHHASAALPSAKKPNTTQNRSVRFGKGKILCSYRHSNPGPSSYVIPAPVIVAVTHWTCIRQVPWTPAILTEVLVVVLSFFKCWGSTSAKPRLLSIKFFPIYRQTVFLSRTLWSLRYYWRLKIKPDWNYSCSRPPQLSIMPIPILSLLYKFPLPLCFW